MKRILTAAALCLATQAPAQIVDGVVLHTDITLESLSQGIERMATNDVSALPPLVVQGYLALIDPDYYETPMAMSPIAQIFAKNIFRSASTPLERKVIEIAVTRAFDQHFDHDLILSGTLDQAFLGPECYGVFWTLQSGMNQTPQAATVADQVTLIAQLAASHYNRFMESDLNPFPHTPAVVQFGPVELWEPDKMNVAFTAVLDALVQDGLLTEEEQATAVADGPSRIGRCPSTVEGDGHPNDLTRGERLRFVVDRSHRTPFRLSAILYPAVLGRLDMTEEEAFEADSPLARAFVADVWANNAQVRDMFPDEESLLQVWQEAWRTPFEIAPMYLETLPLGLGCTGPTALIEANWPDADPGDLAPNQQATLAALILHNDPDVLIGDSEALRQVRDDFLQSSIIQVTVPEERLAAIQAADPAPLTQHCSD